MVLMMMVMMMMWWWWWCDDGDDDDADDGDDLALIDETGGGPEITSSYAHIQLSRNIIKILIMLWWWFDDDNMTMMIKMMVSKMMMMTMEMVMRFINIWRKREKSIKIIAKKPHIWSCDDGIYRYIKEERAANQRNGEKEQAREKERERWEQTSI